MGPALQAFLVAFGVVFLAELPDKTMFATIVLTTRYHRPLAVVIGVTVAMAFHSVLAVVVGEGLRHLPRTPTEFAVAAVFVVGGRCCCAVRRTTATAFALFPCTARGESSAARH